MDLLRLEGVTKTYRMGAADVRALDGVTLGFERGSFWALMGPSGSGKSTLLNLLGLLDRPTSGRYLFEGRDVAGLPDEALSELRLRHIGFIFQSFNLIPQLTVAENIELPLFYLGWTEEASAARARELALHVGLGDRLGHRPPELSGGQQQRVAIARALIHSPAILLADEPTGNLDSHSSDNVLSRIQTIHRELSQTIVLITHDHDVAASAERIVTMKDGVVQEA